MPSSRTTNCAEPSVVPCPSPGDVLCNVAELDRNGSGTAFRKAMLQAVCHEFIQDQAKRNRLYDIQN